MRAAARACSGPTLRSATACTGPSDGGDTWTHLGLRDGQQIASIAVDPRDPNRLFVGVLGHPYGPNAERGVYRSLDGGATFTQVLYKNENVGAFDVVIDPQRPQRRLCNAVGRSPSAVGDRRLVRDAGKRGLQVERRRHELVAVECGPPGAHRAFRNSGCAQRLEGSLRLRRRRSQRGRRRSPLSQR